MCGPTFIRQPVLQRQALRIELRRLRKEPLGFMAGKECFLSFCIFLSLSKPCRPRAKKSLYFGSVPLTGCHMVGQELQQTTTCLLYFFLLLPLLPFTCFHSFLCSFSFNLLLSTSRLFQPPPSFTCVVSLRPTPPFCPYFFLSSLFLGMCVFGCHPCEFGSVLLSTPCGSGTEQLTGKHPSRCVKGKDYRVFYDD